MRKLTWMLGALLGVLTRPADAQSLEPLSFIQGETFARTTELGGSPSTQYASNSFAARLRFPVFLDGKETILLPGVNYQRLDLSSTTPGPAGERSVSLQAPVSEMGLVHRTSDGWMVGGFLTAGLASDFEDAVSRDDWSVVARVLAMRKLADGLRVGATLGYDRSTGDFSVVPLLRAAWSPGARWRVVALLPKAAEVSYKPSRWLKTAFRSELESSRFHLAQSRYGVEDLYLEYFALKAGPSLTFSPLKFLHLDVQGGYAFMRRVSAKINDGSPGFDAFVNREAPARQIDLAPTAFLAVRLWMGLDGAPKEATEERSKAD